MTAPAATQTTSFASFRTRLLLAMMLLVSAATAVALFFAQRNLAATVRSEFERQFRSELAALHAVQQVRHAALAERCRALARKPRLHAALEDNALDLLYPSARDELLSVLAGPDATDANYAFHAVFYRFLNSRGAAITPPDEKEVGALDAVEIAQLALRALPAKVETGYLWHSSGDALNELIAMPITSSETGEVIAALVLGFAPVDFTGQRADAAIRSGIWTQGRLYLPALPEAARKKLGESLTQHAASGASESSFNAEVAGTPCLVFYTPLNPGSPFAPAYEVCLYPLTQLLADQQRLFWQYAIAGVLLVGAAFVASRVVTRRLSAPVEQLAVDSEQNRAERVRAEAALELTHEELQRAARFSADASHQLKTPVTVLRAGLEELLAGERLTPEVREEVSGLVHQTFRLTSVIEDLLLLSRMDAGRLRLNLAPVDLIPLIEGWRDDLGAIAEEPELQVETELPSELRVAGERRYTTLIVQNLLENARKYNRSGGRIRIAARDEGEWTSLTIGNTGAPIPAAAQAHIFERFHRGTAGEDKPGHGLGLNLARELARLHGGELRLVRSADDWTEFEVRFRPARAGVMGKAAVV